MNEFIEIINNVGFPIGCVIVLGWYSFKTTDKVIALTEKVTTALTQNSDKMSDLAKAIEKMLEKEE